MLLVPLKREVVYHIKVSGIQNGLSHMEQWAIFSKTETDGDLEVQKAKGIRRGEDSMRSLWKKDLGSATFKLNVSQQTNVAVTLVIGELTARHQG